MELEFSNKPAPGDSERRGSELQHTWQHTYISLLKLKRAIETSEDMADPNEPVEESKIDTMFSLEMDLPQSPTTCSSMPREDITETKPRITDFIVLKPHYKEHIVETASLGQNELWSSTNLYHHLELLENTFHISPNGSAHAWIEAFCLRVSAMLPQNQHMIFKAMKEIVIADSSSDLSALSRFVDYTVIVADQYYAATFLRSPLFTVLNIHKPSTFFIIEAKDPSGHIPSQVHQAVYQMFMCGKFLQNKVVRGALTNGHDWIFLLIKLNDNYEGASYKQSDMIHLEVMKNPDFHLVIPKPWPDLISAILLHWIGNSFVDLGSDDWFETVSFSA
ncbi:hypothetical protein V8E53_010273 [Lactarius tabidus]